MKESDMIEKGLQGGLLYIVATPIGNLDDMTFRAVKILGEVDVVAAEDTRHTGLLLKHFGISATLTSYHDFNKEDKTAVILERLQKGSNIALVSDAGTPAISDPGYFLITRALEAGIRVVPIPGASAFVAALSASGMPSDRFTFYGFLPRKKNRRLTLIREIGVSGETAIIYESPARINRTLMEIYDCLGDATVVVAREITKLHEEIIKGKVAAVIKKIGTRKLKGEITLLVSNKAM